MKRISLIAAAAAFALVSVVAVSVPNRVVVFMDLSATSLTGPTLESYAQAYIAKSATTPQAGVNYTRLLPDDTVTKPVTVVDTSGDPLSAMVSLSSLIGSSAEISAILVGDSSLVTTTILDNFLFVMANSPATSARLASVPVVSFLDATDDLCVPADTITTSIGASNHIVCAGVRDRAEVVAIVDLIRTALEWESFGLITGAAAATTTSSSTATATVTTSKTEVLYHDVLAAQVAGNLAIPTLSSVASLQRFAAPVNLSAPDLQAADDDTLKTILRRYVRGVVLHSVSDVEYDRLVAARARLASSIGTNALFFLATRSSINRLSTMTSTSTTSLGSAMVTPHYTPCSSLVTAASASTNFSSTCDERGAYFTSALMDTLMLFMASPSNSTSAAGSAVITAANLYAGSFNNPLTSPSGGSYCKFRFTAASLAAAATATLNVYNSPLVLVSNIAQATLVKDAQTTTAPSQRLDTAFHLRSASRDSIGSLGATTSIVVWGVAKINSAVFVSIETIGRSIIITATPRLIPASPLRSVTACILSPPTLADAASAVRLYAQLDYHNRAVFANLTSSVVDTAVAITPVLLNTGTDGVAVISTLLPMLTSSAASTTSCTVVVGPGRSRYSTAIAPLLNRYAVPHLEFTESDPAVINAPANYPYISSVTVSDVEQYKITADICAKFNWERVVVINVATETDRLAALSAALQEQTIGVEKVYSLTSWPLVNSTTSTLSTSMQQLNDIFVNIRDAAISRIVIPILPVSDSDARLFLKQALTLKMNGTQIFIFDAFMSRFLHEERWSQDYYTVVSATTASEVVYNNTFQSSSSTQPLSTYAADELPMVVKQIAPTLRQYFPSSICIKPALGGSTSTGLDPALAVVRQLPYYLHMGSTLVMKSQKLTDVESDGLSEAEEAAAKATIKQAIHDAGFPADISKGLRSYVGRAVFEVTPGNAPVNSSRLLVDQWIDNGAHSAFAMDAGMALIDLFSLTSAGGHPVNRSTLLDAFRARFGSGNNASIEYPIDLTTSPPSYKTSSMTAAQQDTDILNRKLQLIMRSTVGSIGNGYRFERIAGYRVDTTDASYLIDLQIPAETVSSSLYQTIATKLGVAASKSAAPVERAISPFGDILTFARWKDAGSGSSSTIYNRLSYILPSDYRITWLDGSQTYSGNPDLTGPTSSIRSIQFIAKATLTASPGAIAFSILGFGVTVAVFAFCYRRYQTQQMILVELYAMDDGTLPRGKYQPALRPISNDIEEGAIVTDNVYASQ